jgi:hypothetical protein
MLRRSTSFSAGALAVFGTLLIAAAPAMAAGHGAAGRGPLEGRRRVSRKEVQSSNWSGYAAYGTTFTSAKGTWVQPKANCNLKKRQVALAAFWVGLDGYENKTVEQIGTDADCEGRTEFPYAWFEFYPERFFVIEEPVEPGDVLHAEVTQTRLFLEDETQGWSFEKAYSPGKLEFASAEWIAESPSSRLSNFGSVEFTEAFAADESGEKSVEEWAPNLDSVVLVSHTGRRATRLAEPVGLSGSSFSIVQP